MPLDREELEEQLAAARDIAKLTKAQFDGFVEAGFTDAQALSLTKAWLDTSMNGGKG